MAFSFLAPPEILFGPDESLRTLEVARRFGSRVFLVTGGRSFDSLPVAPLFSGMERWTVSGEPDVATVDEGTRRCRRSEVDVVVAIGGGSVLDAGKAVAAMARHDGSVRDYLEQVGERKLKNAPLPFIAVPTTAGSGSEATKNAVIRIPDLQVKRSLRHDLMLPKVAIVDPRLSATAPRLVAVSAALDAFTHLLEGYVSKGATPMTDALALRGLMLAFEALDHLESSWESMALASLWGGMVLANAGLGAVHGLVAPLGGRCSVPHGIGCACLLAGTVRCNLQAMQSRDPRNPALQRYEAVATALGLKSPQDLVDLLLQYHRRFNLPALSGWGLRPEEVVPIVQASRGGSMRFNPIELSDAELEGIVVAAMGP